MRVEIDLQSTIPCQVRRGRVIAQRHDVIRKLLTSRLSKVCKNGEVEPYLLTIDNEVFDLGSTVTNTEARFDVRAGSFWTRGVTAFFHVRDTHVNSTRNQNKSTEIQIGLRGA